MTYLYVIRHLKVNPVKDNQQTLKSIFSCIHNTPIHNILSTASQLSISHKALETLPEDGNVMPKYAEATTHN